MKRVFKQSRRCVQIRCEDLLAKRVIGVTCAATGFPVLENRSVIDSSALVDH